VRSVRRIGLDGAQQVKEGGVAVVAGLQPFARRWPRYNFQTRSAMCSARMHTVSTVFIPVL